MSVGHYFDDDPDSESSPHPVEITLPDISLTLTADRGVFSADKLDTGTKLLLLETPPMSEAATILDIGCGWGPITCVAAMRAPEATVWAVDVNRRARALTEANAASIGAADRVRVAAPDDVPTDVRFDRILSNPPIRVGKDILHQILRRWLPRLTPDGIAHLVVQKHLGSDSLAKWLDDDGFPATRLSSRAGYRVLEVRRGDSDRIGDDSGETV
ncbi:MAG: methyltransferase [Acidimicrobiales bacterium]